MPSFNNLVAKLGEQRPSNWTSPRLPSKRLGDYIQYMLVDPTVETGVTPTLWATVPSMMESAKPLKKSTLTSITRGANSTSADKAKGPYIPSLRRRPTFPLSRRKPRQCF